MIKTILGYDIADGLTTDEYEEWLFTVHVPDILANPYVDKLVFNKVLRPVERTSAGTSPGAQPQPFYRIAEMYFKDEDRYRRYLAWFDEHPVQARRGPAGRTNFRFYVVADSVEIARDASSGAPSGP